MKEKTEIFTGVGYWRHSSAALLGILFTAYCAVAQDTVLSVRNIAALQAIDTSSLTPNNTVLVLGYYNPGDRGGGVFQWQLNSDRKSTRLNSSHLVISYAVFCLKKKN